MTYENRDQYDVKLFENLKNDCGKCFGFCCVALYFTTSDGFPTDKEAGKPCMYLQCDFSCVIHDNLIEKGLKGCTAYDCFGAGQKVAQVTYNGQDWRKDPESASQMFEVFSTMRQLHEMLWYLSEAISKVTDSVLHDDLKSLLSETERLTFLSAIHLIELDIASHRAKVNSLLQKTSELDQTKVPRDQKKSINRKKTIAGRLDLIGVDLRKINLTGVDLRGAFLIAADLREINLKGTNLIGADLRDADIRGANLTESLYITQSQVNTAKGDARTKLPIWLDYPKAWIKK
ncbi:MAG: pentapeptide repeat-containing protein [Dethiosulfatibacter sp.]|nr:pentapeptide repeat-containing protein [Dethiosulfatibacter sp.]